MDKKIKTMILAMVVLALSVSVASCGSEADDNTEPPTGSPGTQ